MSTASAAPILTAIGMLFSVMSLVYGSLLSFTTLVIQALIIYYLNRPEVKACFRRE